MAIKQVMINGYNAKVMVDANILPENYTADESVIIDGFDADVITGIVGVSDYKSGHISGGLIIPLILQRKTVAVHRFALLSVR